MLQKIHLKTVKKIPKRMQDDFEKFKKASFQEVHNLSAEELKIHDDQFWSMEDCFNQIIVLENNQILGGLKLFKRQITFDNIPILLGGIGGVWVRNDKQKKGIGFNLIKRAIDLLKINKCDIAFLCTEIQRLGKFYSKIGFVPLVKKYKFYGKSGNKYFGEDGMIAPIVSEQIFKKVLKSKKVFDLEKGNW